MKRSRIEENNDSKTFISALDYVKDHLDLYLPEENLDSKDWQIILDTLETVTLLYPGDVTESFPMIAPLKDGYNPIMDLIKTIAVIAEDFPDIFGDPTDPLSDKLYRKIERAAKKKDYASVKLLIHQFNDILRRDIISNKDIINRQSLRALSYDQSIIVLDQIYARVVHDPDALRHYKGFSKEVYGETRHPVINDIIKRLSIKENQTFLDLGSGIGNVVLQVAMQTRCKSYGIELLEIPHSFARAQLAEYRSRMSMYGRTASTVHLSKGDFLEDERVSKIIGRVDVVFVNNYAFESDMNHRLMQLFLSMREGATIISFRPFRPVDYKITQHNMNGIASILTVEKVGYGSGGVSWTASTGEFYIQRIDRQLLNRFIESQGKRLSRR